jgi:hypothetical protein
MVSLTTRALWLVGRTVASMPLQCTLNVGEATRSSTAAVPMATSAGRRITPLASRYQPPAWAGGLTRLIRRLSSISSDGTMSRALATATTATIAPPRPIETRNRWGKTHRLASAAATVAALNKIVRPVVASVTRSARSASPSRRISSRKRQTRNKL